MTRFQKISATATVCGVFVLPFMIWLVSWHLALASSEDLTYAVEKVQKEQRDNRRRDLLKDNKRDLGDVRFKLYELKRRIDPDNEAQAQLISGLEQTESGLVTDQACIVQTGRECAEDLVE